MFYNTSITDISGEIVSGFGVIIVLNVVRSEGSYLATTLKTMFLNPKILTNSPLSTTKATFFDSVINVNTCLTVECSDTIVDDALEANYVKLEKSYIQKSEPLEDQEIV